MNNVHGQECWNSKIDSKYIYPGPLHSLLFTPPKFIVAGSCDLLLIKSMFEKVCVVSECFELPKSAKLLRRNVKKYCPAELLLDVCKTRWITINDGIDRFEETVFMISLTDKAVNSADSLLYYYYFSHLVFRHDS